MKEAKLLRGRFHMKHAQEERRQRNLRSSPTEQLSNWVVCAYALKCDLYLKSQTNDLSQWESP